MGTVWIFFLVLILLAIIACVIVLFFIKRNNNKMIVLADPIVIADTTAFQAPGTLFSLESIPGKWLVVYSASYLTPTDEYVDTSLSGPTSVSCRTFTAATRNTSVVLQTVMTFAPSDALSIVISNTGALMQITYQLSMLRIG
jgi:hypothetical protein